MTATHESLPAQPAVQLLLVDDEPNILKSLARLFRSKGYIIHTAENGIAGLDILRQQPIDLVISDMRMPHMDGAEFLEKVANQWPDTVRMLLTGFADMESTIAAVNKGRIYSYFNKPWEDNELKMQVARAIEQKRLREERQQLFEIINTQNAQLKELNATLEEKVDHRTAQLKSTLAQLDVAHKSLKKQYTETVKAFSKIIEMRPGIKSGRSKYIAEKALQVARKLDMSQEEQKNILYAGLLIQIGKIGLPEALLAKSGYCMSAQEQKQYFNHAVEGEALLKGLSQLKGASVLIRHQYEKYDGSGFPNALSKEEIPLGSRILHVINDYIAYLEGSVTGKPMSVSEVQTHLRNRAQRFYDPIIVEAFLEVLEEANARIERPIVEISWTQLAPGIEIEEVSLQGRIYLKNCILDKKRIHDLIALRGNLGRDLSIKVRVGADEKLLPTTQNNPEKKHD
ncbi:MAG: HD domain-containing phosphohydrolase [Gammaproteobacteria bacterium]